MNECKFLESRQRRDNDKRKRLFEEKRKAGGVLAESNHYDDYGITEDTDVTNTPITSSTTDVLGAHTFIPINEVFQNLITQTTKRLEDLLILPKTNDGNLSTSASESIDMNRADMQSFTAPDSQTTILSPSSSSIDEAKKCYTAFLEEFSVIAGSLPPRDRRIGNEFIKNIMSKISDAVSGAHNISHSDDGVRDANVNPNEIICPSASMSYSISADTPIQGITTNGAPTTTKKKKFAFSSANKAKVTPQSSNPIPSPNNDTPTLNSSIISKENPENPIIPKFSSSTDNLISIDGDIIVSEENEDSEYASAAIGSGGAVFTDRTDEIIHIPPSSAVFVRNLRNCVIYALPTNGSFFISKAVNCKLYCAPHQLRMKHCSSVEVYTWCCSRPIIEGCTDMKFGGYDAWIGLGASAAGLINRTTQKSSSLSLLHSEDLKKTDRPALSLTPSSSLQATSYLSTEEICVELGKHRNLEWSCRSFKEVDDFNWIKQRQSPNWCVLEREEWTVSDVVSC